MTIPQPPVAPPAYRPAQWADHTGDKPKRNVLGIIALALAGVGFVFACLPGALILGWILLPIAFTLGIIAACLKGKIKWQGLTAIIVSVIGTITGIIVFFAVVATSFTNAFTDHATVGSHSSNAVKKDAGTAGKAQGSRQTPLVFNTPISTKDWDVALTAFNRNGDSVVAAVNEFNEVPPAGQQYVVVDLRATYKGSSEGSASAVQVDYVTADGKVIHSRDNVVVGIEPTFGEGGGLLAGATDTGKLVFLVPSTVDGMIRVKAGYLADEMYFKLA